jgi:glycerol-3-phosphate dehydrogenase
MHIEGIPESDVSRKHLLYNHLEKEGIGGLLSIIGGKLTAYRYVAEDVVDAACRILKHPAKSRTAELPLPGGMLSDLERYVTVHSEAQAARFGVEPGLIAPIIRTYGARYGRVLDFAAGDPALFAQISPHHPDILAQVVHAVKNEGARTLSDVMLRRLTSGMCAGRGREGAEAVAALVAELLEWDRDRVRAELDALDEQVALGAAPDAGDELGRVTLVAG